jgi:Cdc6-like AAA superfamily ATPase
MKIRALILSLALALPGLAAAANRHDAELAMTAAASALESAERAGAAQYATDDLTNARNGMAHAQGLANDRDWTESMLASEKTRADAILAEARSRQARAEATTAEVEAAVRTLRVELDRAGG